MTGFSQGCVLFHDGIEYIDKALVVEDTRTPRELVFVGHEGAWPQELNDTEVLACATLVHSVLRTSIYMIQLPWSKQQGHSSI